MFRFTIRDVLWLILRQEIAVTATGLTIGVAAAFALSRFVGSFVYGVEPTDPISVAAAVVIMAMVATAAGFFPAHRAARLDPLSALRYE